MMSRRPIVSYGGDCSLFCGLQGSLVAALPEETVEWRRSFGRTSRFVNIEVDFVPFSEQCLVKDPARSVLQQPIFHTYWTDCTDVESYKSNVRESVLAWVGELRQHAITDWMVVVVGAPDNKKTNKLLPRTTVLDKMKADFGGKQAERCVSLYEPVKTDSRSMESWQALLAKMRSLIMLAYNRTLNKFEENMRAERERRTEKSWSFCTYFSVQEELAEVLLQLGVRDEALVQYDELDALLTQFVLNSAAGDTPLWLANFRQTCERWEGLYLSSCPEKIAQARIQSKSVSLLELRNYLFQQQAALLLQLGKPWEMASRALSFLQNTANELQILAISIAKGGVACWGFLSCLEVIHALARFNLPSATHAHARHAAPLWAYARDKLQELGRLCGLQPGCSESSSNQLHTVIALVCGMGDDPHQLNAAPSSSSSTYKLKPAADSDVSSESDLSAVDGNCTSKRKTGIAGALQPGESGLQASAVASMESGSECVASFGVAMLEQDHMTPMTRLKEALSSKEAFRKHYLELSEVAISTYKHIGHVRSARLIGRDLASFYLKLGQPQQAANFLSDLLHSFDDGCWPLLAADTRTQLQTCYQAMKDWSKLVRVSTELACCSALNDTRRAAAFDVMMDAAQDLQPEEVVNLAACEVVSIEELLVTSHVPVTLGSVLTARVTLSSRLPAAITFEKIEVLLKMQAPEDGHNTSSSSSGSSGAGSRKRSNDSGRLERKVSAVGSGTQHHGKHHGAGGVNRSNSGGSETSEGGRAERRATIPEEEGGEEEGAGAEGQRLQMSLHLDYKQDNTLASAAVVCYNAHVALSRRDSHGRLASAAEHGTLTREESDTILSASSVTVEPGTSTLELQGQVQQKGVLVSKGAVLRACCLELTQTRLLHSPGCGLPLEVLQQAPRLVLGRKGRDLIAGLSQRMLLTLHAGTAPVAQDTAVELRSSRGLLLSPAVWRLTGEGDERVSVATTAITGAGGATDTAAITGLTSTTPQSGKGVSDGDTEVTDKEGDTPVQEEVSDDEKVRELKILLPAAAPLSSVVLELTVLALLGPQRDTNVVDHIVSVSCPDLHQPRQDIDVHFTPPFCSVAKLHTANTKKFFQVKMSGLVAECVELQQPSLSLQQPSSPRTPLPLTPIHPPDQTMVVCSDQSCSYMWEVGLDYSQAGAPPLKLEFGVMYLTPSTALHTAVRTYRCTFDLADYKTVFTIKSRVEPSKGSEFCRAGTMCHLHITVEAAPGAVSSAAQDGSSSQEPGSGEKAAASAPTRKPSGSGCGDNYESIMYEVLADQTMWAVCGRTSGVLSVESARRRQLVTLDVMPLLGGFLPLPSVRLSKYIPADVKRPDSVVGTASSIPRLEPFAPGQVYNFSKGTQVHVLTAATTAGGASGDLSLS